MDEKQARDTSKETLDQTESDLIENEDDLQDADNRDIASKNEIQQDIIESEKIDPTTTTDLQVAPTHGSRPEKDYSSFSPWQKRFIVLAATMGAFFSPLTTQIYFPALTTIAKDLNVTNSKINLTITTYMILQATAPAFIGGFSDTAGRRPAYIACFVIYIVADIALALQDNYIALLILRMVQSSGSSGTVALVNAVVSDVATSAERGMYIGIASLAAILAPSFGPILGGIISQYAGWKWIFWFLATLAVAFFIPMLLFMPETCHLIVGDGSVPPPKWNRSLLNHINEKKREKEGHGPPDYAERDVLAKKRGPLRFPNPLKTLKVAAEKEGFLVLFYAGIVYSGWYAIMSGMPSQLRDIYGFDDLKVGLMYLPMSGGSILAAFTQGKLVDWSFAHEAKRLGMKVTKSRQQDLSNFPIEKARIKVAMPMLVLACLSTIAYGWILHFRTNIAGPCIMLFIQGFSMISSTQCISILIIDINPKVAGTATAAFNLIRCLLGAGATALILPMTDKMGLGWAYTLIGLIYILLAPMLMAVVKWGPTWRRERKEKEDEKARLKKEKTEASVGVERV